MSRRLAMMAVTVMSGAGSGNTNETDGGLVPDGLKQ
jgi:hypothetical protein